MASNVSKRSSEGKTIEFFDDEMVDVGIDTHKKFFDVTLWSERRGAVVKRWTQPADVSITLKSLEAFAGRIRRVVYEAGPCGYALARALRQTGYTAEVIAPSRTPRSPGQQAKSDRLDSRQLAMWSAKNLLQPVQVPSEEEEADRQVFRLREQMVRKQRRTKQQIKSFLLMHGLAQPEGLAHWTNNSIEALRQLSLRAQLRLALDCLLDDLAHFQAQVARASQALYALARAKRHSRNVHAMKTVPGVGPITAMAVRTELLAPERFDNGQQVAAMVGLAPWSSQSGQTRKRRSADQRRQRTAAHVADRSRLALGRPRRLGRTTVCRTGAHYGAEEKSHWGHGTTSGDHPVAHQRHRRDLSAQTLHRSATRRAKRRQPGQTDRAKKKEAAQRSAAPLSV